MPPNTYAPFAPRGKKAIDLSQREALSLGHEHVDAEHILLGVVRENDGIAARILLESGADYQTIRDELARRLSWSSEQAVTREPASVAPFGASIRVGSTPQIQRVLMAAAERALDHQRTEISAIDLLLALTRDETVAPLLADLGVDEPTVREAIKRRHTPEEPPEASATT